MQAASVSPPIERNGPPNKIHYFLPRRDRRCTLFRRACGARSHIPTCVGLITRVYRSRFRPRRDEARLYEPAFLQARVVALRVWSASFRLVAQNPRCPHNRESGNGNRFGSASAANVSITRYVNASEYIHVEACTGRIPSTWSGQIGGDYWTDSTASLLTFVRTGGRREVSLRAMQREVPDRRR